MLRYVTLKFNSEPLRWVKSLMIICIYIPKMDLFFKNMEITLMEFWVKVKQIKCFRKGHIIDFQKM